MKAYRYLVSTLLFVGLGYLLYLSQSFTAFLAFLGSPIILFS